MYTQCPECRTIFEIDEEALQASFGIVHCGHCAKRFDALRSLSNSLPMGPGVDLPELSATPRIPTLTAAVSAAAMVVSRPRPGRGPDGDPAPDSPDPEAEALRAATEDDDWFTELQADLAAELDSQTPAAPVEASPGNPDPEGDLFAAAEPVAVEAAPVPAPAPAVEPAPPPAGATPAPDASAVGVEAPGSDAPLPPTVAAEPGPEPETMSEPEAAPVPESTIDSAALGLLTPDVAAPAAASGEPDAPEATVATATAAADSVPIAAAAALATAAVPPDAPVAEAVLAGDTGMPQAAAPPPDVAAASESAVAPPDPASLHGNVTMYVRPRRPRRERAGLAWALGCAALAVLLAMQIAWAERTALYLHPATHGWMQRLCQTLPCRLPPIHAPARLALVSRDVRPDPQRPGALSITATLRNDAGFREAWPVVTVVLTDIDNQPVAMRRFRPREYMPDPARRAAGIPPGATVAVAFEVADPGKQARGFQFTFE